MDKQMNVMEHMESNKVLKDFPYAILSELAGNNYYEMKDSVLKTALDYSTYKKGATFATDVTHGDYVPSVVRYKLIKTIIDKEARFMFSQMPDIKVMSDGESNDTEQFQNLIDKVIEHNNFSKILLQAAKDCFIGKRVACLVEMSEEDGIIVNFYSSLNFYYEYDVSGKRLEKFVTFELLKNRRANDGRNRKLYCVKVYERKNSVIYVNVYICDSGHNVVETLVPYKATDLGNIPAVVITNDGTLNDIEGISEVDLLQDYESAYSKINNADIDSIRGGMNPIYYLVDMNSNTTKNLYRSPGSLWETKSEQNQDNIHPMIGVLAPPLNHTQALTSTSERLKSMMYSEIDMPDITQEGLLSGITSFKALKALYYPLIVRCNEKLKTWKPALQFIMQCVLEYARLEPDVVNSVYAIAIEKEDATYEIYVEENYALLEDELEEKEIDLQEINSDAMSVLSYLQKWRGDSDLNTEQKRQNEILQIAKEKNMFDTGSLNMNVQGALEEDAIKTEVEDNIESMEIEQRVGEL